MTTPSAPLRLLAVHAHPDDESSKGAATMAMYAASGVDVLVATCTDGSRGDIQNPRWSGNRTPSATWPGRAGCGLAAKVLGAPAALARVRRFRAAGRRPALADRMLCAAAAGTGGRAAGPAGPGLCDAHVILSYDENGGYPHRISSWRTGWPSRPSRRPAIPHGTRASGSPGRPASSFYDRAFSPDRFRALRAGRGRAAVPVRRTAGRVA